MWQIEIILWFFWKISYLFTSYIYIYIYIYIKIYSYIHKSDYRKNGTTCLNNSTLFFAMNSHVICVLANKFSEYYKTITLCSNSLKMILVVNCLFLIRVCSLFSSYAVSKNVFFLLFLFCFLNTFRRSFQTSSSVK